MKNSLTSQIKAAKQRAATAISESKTTASELRFNENHNNACEADEIEIAAQFVSEALLQVIAKQSIRNAAIALRSLNKATTALRRLSR